MKVDIVIIVLLIFSVGMSSASARVRMENLSGNTLEVIPAISENVGDSRSAQFGSDVSEIGGLNVVAVKFELRRAPQVLLSSGLYDRVVGARESHDSESAFALRHHSFVFSAQPDRWYVLSLILLLLLMQIRALPVTRSRIRDAISRGNGEPMQSRTRIIPLKEAFE
jgi:hypothetical protein